jgi:hypothetical protein
MSTPIPVDLSKLGAILNKSRQVMNKIESEKPVVQSPRITEGLTNDNDTQSRRSSKSGSFYSENDEKDMVFETNVSVQQSNVYNYSDEQVSNSKLPDAIKKVMLEKRIPKLATPPSRFTTEDLAAASGIELNKPTQKQRLNENISNNGDLITVSKTQLTEMVNNLVEKKLLEYFNKNYNKMITQEAVKTTINTLIREGKIVKKKSL